MKVSASENAIAIRVNIGICRDDDELEEVVVAYVFIIV